MLVPSQLFYERTKKKSVYNIQPISNIPSIISRGILSYNRAAAMRHVTIAMVDVQSRRDNVKFRKATLFIHMRMPVLTRAIQ